MKKLISTMLVALLLISMVACGGENPKLAEAKEGFNSISTQFNEVATLMNENKDEMDAELIDLMNELSDMLEKYGDMLENGDSLNDEQLDAIIGWFGTAEEGIAGVKADIETILAAEDTFPEALADVEAYEIPDVSNTAWQLARSCCRRIRSKRCHPAPRADNAASHNDWGSYADIDKWAPCRYRRCLRAHSVSGAGSHRPCRFEYRPQLR